VSNRFSSEMLLCRTWPLRCSKGVPFGQIRQNHGLQNPALLSFAQACPSASIAMPFQALIATIVLPDFARSRSADPEKQSCKSFNLFNLSSDNLARGSSADLENHHGIKDLLWFLVASSCLLHFSNCHSTRFITKTLANVSQHISNLPVL
jgi:hypothetical protein